MQGTNYSFFYRFTYESLDLKNNSAKVIQYFRTFLAKKIKSLIATEL